MLSTNQTYLNFLMRKNLQKDLLCGMLHTTRLLLTDHMQSVLWSWHPSFPTLQCTKHYIWHKIKHCSVPL